MRIKDDRTYDTVEFSAINCGEVFIVPRSFGVYMRTNDVLNNRGNVISNVVDLHYGIRRLFEDSLGVIQVSSKIVLK